MSRGVLLGIAFLCLPGCAPRAQPVPPAPVPELYGAGLFSTGAWDFFMAFSADEHRALFCRANDDFSAYDIFETRKEAAGHWRAPAKPRFASAWSNADPHIAPDGRTVFFISNRPGTGEVGPQATYDIWCATLQPDGEWGEARRVPEPVSVSGVDEWSPSVAVNGNLYFGSERPGGHGGLDLCVAHQVGGVYQAPENLGGPINTPGDEVEPWIAPDESYLIFSAKNRPDSAGRYDIYLSRREHGVWQQAQPLSHGVNTSWLDFNPSVSPDGRWLYFSSTRPHTGPIGERFDAPRSGRNVSGIGIGKGDIYRIALRHFGLGPR
ncbi:MAG: Xaa-Pro aminopeptidase [Thermoanaerobaculia bacterium]